MAAIYLDHHATTPLDPEVLEAMRPYWREAFGNPSSPHCFGWEAAEAIESARQQLASLVSCRPRDVIFTSGGTESNNLALMGVARSHRDRGRHFVTTAVEHAAVIQVFRRLEEEGAEVTVVPVGTNGIVDPRDIERALREDTVLCSVMWANNEIGTLQPVEEIAGICRSRGVLFHSDAAQAVGKIPVDSRRVDLLSLSAHKFHGPKGVGALVITPRHPRIRLEPLMAGGGQQSGMRPGTLPVPLIVGLGRASELAAARMEEDAARVKDLRDHLIHRLTSELEGIHLNGDPQRRLPGNANLRIDGVEAEALILEMREVAVGTTAACSSPEHRVSHVLTALGLDLEQARSSVRFGIGRENTREEIDRASELVVRGVRKLRDFARS